MSTCQIKSYVSKENSKGFRMRWSRTKCASAATITLLTLLAVPSPLRSQIRSTGGILTATPVVKDWPVKVVARIGFAPTSFRADDGSNAIFYELYLTNISARSLSLDGLEVRDPQRPGAAPLASFTGGRLAAMTQSLGAERALGAKTELSIAAGGTVIVFVTVERQSSIQFPDTLVHRLSLGHALIDGPTMRVRHDPVAVLDSPVSGADWIAGDGPNIDPDNHHRRGIFIIDGNLTISRRFAIDWQKTQNGTVFRGNMHDDLAYFSFGQPVLAVTDAKVVATRDGMPDNPAGHGEDFHPALPETLDVVPGNSVILDLGHGQFAHYYHLKKGMVMVKAGDRVRRGQVIAQIGASGDAREPHLHFEVSNSAIPLKGEGLPYVIRSYNAVDGTGQSVRRTMSLPTGGMTVEFGRAVSQSQK